MQEIVSVISEAIRNETTLIAEHYYCEVIREPLTLEVYPYKLDGEFLICYDLQAGQPYAINLNNVINIRSGKRKNVNVPTYLWMK